MGPIWWPCQRRPTFQWIHGLVKQRQWDTTLAYHAMGFLDDIMEEWPVDTDWNQASKGHVEEMAVAALKFVVKMEPRYDALKESVDFQLPYWKADLTELFESEVLLQLKSKHSRVHTSRVIDLVFGHTRFDEFQIGGSGKMVLILQKLLSRLSDLDQEKVTKRYFSLGSESDVILVATACSGSDCPLFVIEALGQIVSAHAMANPHLRLKSFGRKHYKFVFNCESDVRKMAWASQEVLPCFQFKDVNDLGNVYALDLKSQQSVQVPKVHLFIFGFSCKSDAEFVFCEIVGGLYFLMCILNISDIFDDPFMFWSLCQGFVTFEDGVECI